MRLFGLINVPFWFSILAVVVALIAFVTWWRHRQEQLRIGPKLVTHITQGRFPYAAVEAIGYREYMEDRHLVAKIRLPPAQQGQPAQAGHKHSQSAGQVPSQQASQQQPTEASLFCVFDGHAGPNAAEYCVRTFATQLAQFPTLATHPERALVHTFETVDDDFCRLASRASAPMDDGTTAVAALVIGNQLIVANAGDSRAILVRSNGPPIALSNDHKPNRADEHQRIIDAGGKVVFHGVWRVNAVLAVSRAIGDRQLKPVVTARPELRDYRLMPERDAFLILASDGLWDVLQNGEVASIVLGCGGDAALAARRLAREAFDRGSMDNITVVAVDLSKRTWMEESSGSTTGTSSGSGSGSKGQGQGQGVSVSQRGLGAVQGAAATVSGSRVSPSPTPSPSLQGPVASSSSSASSLPQSSAQDVAAFLRQPIAGPSTVSSSAGQSNVHRPSNSLPAGYAYPPSSSSSGSAAYPASDVDSLPNTYPPAGRVPNGTGMRMVTTLAEVEGAGAIPSGIDALLSTPSSGAAGTGSSSASSTIGGPASGLTAPVLAWSARGSGGSASGRLVATVTHDRSVVAGIDSPHVAQVLLPTSAPGNATAAAAGVDASISTDGAPAATSDASFPSSGGSGSGNGSGNGGLRKRRHD